MRERARANHVAFDASSNAVAVKCEQGVGLTRRLNARPKVNIVDEICEKDAKILYAPQRVCERPETKIGASWQRRKVVCFAAVAKQEFCERFGIVKIQIVEKLFVHVEEEYG